MRAKIKYLRPAWSSISWDNASTIKPCNHVVRSQDVMCQLYLSNQLGRVRYGRNARHEVRLCSWNIFVSNLFEWLRVQRNLEKMQRWPSETPTLRSKMLGLDIVRNKPGRLSLGLRGCEDGWAILYRNYIRFGSGRRMRALRVPMSPPWRFAVVGSWVR